MFPPVFTLAFASSAVKALIGTGTETNPFRLYPHGTAPQGVKRPYATYQNITGSPENYLGTLPDADSYTVQVDIFGVSVDSVRAVALALRDAYEPSAHIVRWGTESKDSATGNNRFHFDVSLITLRN